MPFWAACGNGGRWSKGDTRPLISDGRRPGCEEDRLLPGTNGAMAPEGSDEAGIGAVLGADIAGSTGDAELLGGAENLERLW